MNRYSYLRQITGPIQAWEFSKQPCLNGMKNHFKEKIMICKLDGKCRLEAADRKKQKNKKQLKDQGTESVTNGHNGTTEGKS